MKKIRLIVSLTLVIIGISFLLCSVVIGRPYFTDAEDMVPAEGTIISLDDGRPLVSYQFNGFTYQAWMNVSSSTYKLGAPFTLLTDPGDPTRFADPSSRIFIYAFGGVGAAMIVIAAAVFVIMKQKENRVKLLREAGIRQTAVVTAVTRNYSIRVNHRSPWAVHAECIHPRTRETITVKNSAVWETSLQPGDPVDVLFDPMDDGFYTLDLE